MVHWGFFACPLGQVIPFKEFPNGSENSPLGQGKGKKRGKWYDCVSARADKKITTF